MRHKQISIKKNTGWAISVLNERSSCLLMSFFRNGIISRLIESMITSRFYNVIEKYSASDLKKPFFQWFKTKPSVEIKNYNVMIDWPASKKII